MYIVCINLLCILLYASSYPVVSIILSIIVVQKTSQLDVSYGLRLQRNLNIITAYSIVYIYRSDSTEPIGIIYYIINVQYYDVYHDLILGC